MLVIQPRLEEWLIATATQSRLKMRDFGLHERGNDLHKEINSKLEAVRKLIKALEDAGSPRIGHLRSLLNG